LRFLVLALAYSSLPLIRPISVVRPTLNDFAAAFLVEIWCFWKACLQGVIDHFFGLIDAYLVMPWLIEVAGG